MEISLLDLKYAYLAGILDGEGCIRIHRGKVRENSPRGNYSIEIIVGSTSKELIDFLSMNYAGGTVSFSKPRAKGRKASWLWRVYNKRDARHILKMVCPYTIIKQKQIATALEFLDYIGDTPHGGRRSDEDVRVLDHLYEKMVILNHE